MSMGITIQKCLIVGVFCLFFLSTVIPVISGAQIDFFQANKIAKVLFFISPGCGTCPDEAAKLERVLNRIGLKYQIEGIFIGDPPRVGKYLAELRTYPFNFELGLDMDARIAKQYGVKTFQTAVIEVDGKRVIVTRASELSERLR